MSVNLSPVGGVAAQFSDNNGNPLSGGLLYTYASGTATPQAAYTTAQGNTAHTNPIVFNSGGRVSGSGEIWLTDGLNYKFVLEDANGVLIATYDGISGINSNFLAFSNTQEIQTATANQTVFTLITTQYAPATNSLSVFVNGVNQYGPGAQYAYTETSDTVITFTNGLNVGASVKFTTTQQQSAGFGNADQITYFPAGTGAVATTVQSKLRQSVSVLDFFANGVSGAAVDPTGVVPSHLGIQAAINTGKAVFVPQGTYLIEAALQLTTTQQLIYGEGSLSTLKTATNIETMYSSTSVYGVVLEKLNFSNTVSQASGGPTFFQVHFGTGASGCVIRDCQFITALDGSVVRTTHHAGVWFEGANLNNILDCYFQQCHILMGSTDSTIRGGFIYSFAHEYAIKITSAGDVLVEGVRGILGGPSQGCIWIPAASYMNKIVNNYFGGSYTYMNTGRGITGVAQQAMLIQGNTFHEIDGVGIQLTDTAGGGAAILGNNFWAGNAKQNDPTFATPGNQDIKIVSTTFNSSNITITGNTFDRFVGPVEDGMPGIGKSRAIEFTGLAGNYNNVSNNVVSGSGRYYSPAFVIPGKYNQVSGNAGIGTETNNRITGNLELGFDGSSIVKSLLENYAIGGTVSFPLNPNFAVGGVLAVASVRTDLAKSTKTLFALLNGGAGFTLTALATHDLGAGLGMPFTITMPTKGTFLFTSTAAEAGNVTLSFSGLVTSN